MKQTVGLHDFRTAFEQYNRTNFSHEGLEVLFNYLEELENDTGEELELDVIALCCDYSEELVSNAIGNYSIDFDSDSDDEEKKEAVLDYLNYHTSVIGDFGDTVIYQAF